MATIAIGDIHGNLPALRDVLGKILREVSGNDTVVFLATTSTEVPTPRAALTRFSGFNARSARRSFACAGTMRIGSSGRRATTGGIHG